MTADKTETPLFGGNRRSKSEILLKALLNGYQFEFEGHKWCMSDDFRLCVIPESGMAAGMGMAVDCDISVFCKMAERLPEDILIGMVFANGMNSTKVRK